MPDEKMQFRTEGEPAFPNTGKDNPADSSSDKTTDNAPADEGDSKETHQEDDKVPFHKHPRWLEREEEWKGKFNEMESRHQEELRKIREEFAPKKGDSEVPIWFGGTEEQWRAYQEHEEKRLSLAEERALKKIEEKKTKEDALINEAKKYMESEVAAIESDKDLNPKGDKVDANKLLAFVLENDLVDSKGRWNYKAGWRLMQSQVKPAPTRKGLAGATTSEPKAEATPSAFKTSADFKKNRPW